VAALGQIQDQMEALESQGLRSGINGKNMGIVREQLGVYRNELEAIRQARAETGFEDLVKALGTAANGIIDKYRTSFAGQDRRTRDVNVLNDLCDGLYDIAWQMDELDRVREDTGNQQNLDVVLDYLRLYQREHSLVKEAQSGS
jgi:hypothetical protein